MRANYETLNWSGTMLGTWVIKSDWGHGKIMGCAKIKLTQKDCSKWLIRK